MSEGLIIPGEYRNEGHQVVRVIGRAHFVPLGQPEWIVEVVAKNSYVTRRHDESLRKCSVVI